MAGAGGEPTERIIMSNLHPKKHGDGTAVNLIGRASRPHVSFYLDREKARPFPSGELLGRLP